MTEVHEQILQAVAQAFEVPRRTILQRSKGRHLLTPRRAFLLLMREIGYQGWGEMSYPEIGRVVPWEWHTVRHHVRIALDHYQHDYLFRRRVDNARAMVQAEQMKEAA